ncbi:Pycsar system effector family protein [Actinacidiphila rubida]|uniref:Pycsar system effector family protein n=1 Tax=Actinacidiphila rubida TaxID=310780 RepID=UPI00114D3045|nr:Pycsar system effector family protein [Actinacidiphila rubida]
MATAWRLHASLAEWTGRIDAKASFALTIESALLAGVGATSSTGRGFGGLSGWWAHAELWAGVTLLTLSAIAAVLAVLPRVGPARAPRPGPGPDDYLFYGDLHRWTPQELAERLGQADPLTALTGQIVTMSAIMWAKHRRVRQSLLLAVAGAGLLGLAVATG